MCRVGQGQCRAGGNGSKLIAKPIKGLMMMMTHTVSQSQPLGETMPTLWEDDEGELTFYWVGAGCMQHS